jgi:hypothetical protein
LGSKLSTSESVIVTIRLQPSSGARVCDSIETFIRANSQIGFFASVRRHVRFIAAASAGLAFCASTTTDVSASLAPLSRIDRRAEKLNRFFGSYNCPAPYHAEAYIHAADAYGIDYRLLPAISIRESHCGLEERQLNNWWGYHPGRCTFASIEKGIHYVSRQLGSEYPYKGKSLAEKLFTYNPRSAYPGEVEWIMRQIEALEPQ